MKALPCLLLSCASVVAGSLPTLPPFDPEVYAWGERCRTNGASNVDGACFARVDEFMVNLKSAGLRFNIHRLNLMDGPDFAHDSSTNLGAAQMPLILETNAPSNRDWSLGAASVWSYNETGTSSGLKGDGTVYLNTRATDLGMTDNDGHLSFVRVDAPTESAFQIGGQSDGAASAHILIKYSGAGNLTRGDLFNDATSASYTDSIGTGFYHVSRIDGTTVKLYRNGALQNSSGSAGGSRTSFVLYVFALNNAGDNIGGGSLISSCRGCGYSIGNGFDGASATNYYNKVWLPYLQRRGVL